MARIAGRTLAMLAGLFLGAPSQLGAADRVQPTVTAAEGDLGGKFFGAIPPTNHIRHYFVAAEITPWFYVPQRRDPTGLATNSTQLAGHQAVPKVRYHAYTDATFSVRALPTPRLGLLGPVLRGVVGDYIVVTFLNRAQRPLSMHPHGVRYDKDSEGAYYQPSPGKGAAVAPGAKFTYVWHLDAASGPQAGEPSSKVWLYHSHVRDHEDINAGLVGCLVVTDPTRARPDGTPNDVDREEFSLFQIFPKGEAEEEAEEAMREAVCAVTNAVPQRLPPAGPMNMVEPEGWPTINGLAYGNLSGLEMTAGERVRWYLLGLGAEKDLHTAHWHGARVVEGGRQVDVVELLPASMRVADLVADNPGSWLFHCHVADHMMGGMYALYTVHPRNTAGSNRALDEAFPGVAGSQSSLRIRSLLRNPEGNSWSITGRFTTTAQTKAVGQRVELALGKQKAAFVLREDGRGGDQGFAFHITDALPQGFVVNDSVNFEATVPMAGEPGHSESLTIRFGGLAHRALLPPAPSPGN